MLNYYICDVKKRLDMYLFSNLIHPYSFHLLLFKK